MREDYWTKTSRSMLRMVKEIGAMPFVLFQYYLTYQSSSDGIRPSLQTTADDLGLTKSAVCNLKKILLEKEWINESRGEIFILKSFRKNEYSEKMNNSHSEKMNNYSEKMNDSFRKNESPYIRNEKEYSKRNKNPLSVEREEFFNSYPPQLSESSSPLPDSRNVGTQTNKVAESKKGFLGETAAKNKKIKPFDERRNHPAIKMIVAITCRYPLKDTWNRIIREIGDNPDSEFFTRTYEIWRSVNGNPNNLEKWLFEPNKTGKPPEIFGRENQNETNQKFITAREKSVQNTRNTNLLTQQLLEIGRLQQEECGIHGTRR
ncbi:MAG: hypothetical protein K1X72_06515 [Pyrinomonadaceae bacterium]|nr:hypothetical protein [Pyrinomonadaceae bacterium]